MSDRTDALTKALFTDLSEYLDDYQLDVLSTGRDLWPDATTIQAQCFMLGQSLLKKYNEKPDPSPEACAIALGKFRDSNVRCRDWSLNLESSAMEVIIGTVKRTLDDFWHEDGYPLFSTFGEVFSSGALGKGMNVLARGPDLYTKLWDSPLTYTNESLPFVWEKLCSQDPRWQDAERLRNQRYGLYKVTGNKLSFVNKNVTVARSICTEPTLNMWMQLGVGNMLGRRMKRFFGIDLANQAEVNGALAREGSKTGRFATIDLESASDSVGTKMLQEILPADMLAWLMRFRSPAVTLPDGEVVELDMISSMGNGFTFPLQSIVFSAVVAAVYGVKGYSLERYGPATYRNFGVFGDDIIVVSELAPLVIETLRVLGFRVNSSKTFVEGPFRESCGQDFYNGSWCRGVYIKSLRRTQDAYVAINGLNRWSAITGVRLPTLVGWLYRWCHRVDYIPPDESDDAGIQVPLTRARGVKHLQHGIQQYKYSAAVPLALEYNPDTESFVERKGLKDRRTNPHGLVLCFLNGNIKGSRKSGKHPWGYAATLRQSDVVYKTKSRITSSWNSLLPESRFSLTEWPRWLDAVLDNLPVEDKVAE